MAEQIYGSVDKAEFELILKAYDKQQADPKSKHKAVTCDQVKGGSFAKMLFAKPGFHNPGSTRHLIGILDIKDNDRDSLLGGTCDYKAPEQYGLKDLMEIQTKYYIREESKKIFDMIERRDPEKTIGDLIKKLFEEKPEAAKNADALAVNGKWALRCKSIDLAVRDLEFAVMNDCWNPVASRLDYANALCEQGLLLYVRQDYTAARAKFCLALTFNPEHHSAELHKNLCENKLNTQNRPFGSRDSFRDRRK